jgi:Tfp pilus assembly protein PilF
MEKLSEPLEPQSATAWLADSYARQAQHDLAAARTSAERATELAPNFGFAWARLAELEFSHGHRGETAEALRQARALAPRLGSAVVLHGFVLAGENRIEAARRTFNEAIELDGALGDAWLGRGLCRIRLGDVEGGREDLLVAATVEPQRALLRSYLGKAFALEGESTLAARELSLARGMDAGDPTAWLYSALLHRQENENNDSVRQLEQARELNDNRRVYRSQLLLDQDRAVQGVNLAAAYADVGMEEVSAREAGKAVQMDPANFAAHLFLGDSYQRLRDPDRFSQRFETAAVTEYLLANLLSPVGAGTLAQSVTQNEYAKLFESDGLGFSSTTEYASRGAWVESAAQYGTWRDYSYALSGFYHTDPGQRANNDVLQHEISLQLKEQLSASDSVYFRAIQSEIETGDRAALQDPAQANRTLRVQEEQAPILLGGFHRQWTPELHSLLLVGWLDDEQGVHDEQGEVLLFDGIDVLPLPAQQRYRAEEQLFTGEVQQLWQRPRQQVIVGARYQNGQLETQNAFTTVIPTFPEHETADLERASGYGYYDWQPIEPLHLVAGLSYDWLQYPINFRAAPISSGETETTQLSPKGGIIWTPSSRTTCRAGYSQSLGGVGAEQSLRLEPTQIAGFNQAFRSIMPESLVGALSAARFETVGLAVEQRLGLGTYLGISGEWLQSDAAPVIGTYTQVVNPNPDPFVKSSTRQHLDYDEHNLLLTFNQLVGREWAFGVRYRLSHAALESRFANFPATSTLPPRTDDEAVLHQVGLSGLYQHPSGFFGQAEAWWYGQVNHGAAATVGQDEFWQLNAWAGWRMWRRRLEIRAGVLNITGQDYRLNPLNLTPDLPRERTFVAGLKINL